eukprot:7389818-Prymnesium_polylepis.1
MLRRHNRAQLRLRLHLGVPHMQQRAVLEREVALGIERERGGKVLQRLRGAPWAGGRMGGRNVRVRTRWGQTCGPIGVLWACGPLGV